MSEQSAAIAAETGVPELLVMRSAQARAQAAGTSVEEVLAAWSGGGAVGSAPQPAAPEPAAPEAAAPEAAAPEAAAPEAAAPEAAAPEAAPEPVAQEASPVSVAAPSGGSGPAKVLDRRAGAAPVLVGKRDRPISLLVGLLTLFVAGALFAVGLPGADARSIAAEQLPNTTPQLSELAIDGRGIYLQEGCFYCHTQLVRSVVTDVGLGTVTEPGTAPSLSPETYGFQRIGPDLTHVGSREPTNDAGWLREFLTDPGSVRPGTLQPSYAYLSADEMNALVQFLQESG